VSRLASARDEPVESNEPVPKAKGGPPATTARSSPGRFPATSGGFRAGSCLNKPIAEAAKAAGIMKHLSPYFVRRTFQDLCRAAQVHDFVARAISGHATVEMQEHYSTVGGEEVRAGLANVISRVGFRREHHEGGYPNADEKMAGWSGDSHRPMLPHFLRAGYQVRTGDIQLGKPPPLRREIVISSR
jgi:hypothetical protein